MASRVSERSAQRAARLPPDHYSSSTTPQATISLRQDSNYKSPKSMVQSLCSFAISQSSLNPLVPDYEIRFREWDHRNQGLKRSGFQAAIAPVRQSRTAKLISACFILPASPTTWIARRFENRGLWFTAQNTAQSGECNVAPASSTAHLYALDRSRCPRRKAMSEGNTLCKSLSHYAEKIEPPMDTPADISPTRSNQARLSGHERLCANFLRCVKVSNSSGHLHVEAGDLDRRAHPRPTSAPRHGKSRGSSRRVRAGANARRQ